MFKHLNHLALQTQTAIRFERLCCVVSDRAAPDPDLVSASIQIVRASSPNASATRRLARASTPSS